MAIKYAMTYQSTRGEDEGAGYSDIVLKGLAADGGLFMPRIYPQVTKTDLEDWRHLSYAELAFEILRLFATDIEEDTLKTMLAGVYREDVYNNGRTGEDFSKITPTRSIDGGKIRILELSNGPTLAFKDMAMQYLGALFEYILEKRNTELNILGATSGDTGSAAEYAMRGRKGVRVFMLSPEGRMSAFQRAQMYSLKDPNIFNIAVKGSFDDAQDIVKACSQDAGFKATYNIGTVNSINWARVSAQVVYYFKGWLEVTEKPGEVIDVTVPSGNFGNILAGWIAKQMGLPIGRLVVATNENDVLDEFFKTGVYRVRDSEHTFVTSSPSMDISKASNFERYIYDIVGRNAGRIRDSLLLSEALPLLRAKWRKCAKAASCRPRAPMPIASIRFVKSLKKKASSWIRTRPTVFLPHGNTCAQASRCFLWKQRFRRSSPQQFRKRSARFPKCLQAMSVSKIANNTSR